jgi:diketogulonate reductase-like aldo/keto reductase
MTEQVNIHTIRLNNGLNQPLVALGTYGTYGVNISFFKAKPKIFLASIFFHLKKNEEQGKELVDAIKTAIKIGYRHFDTAWFYQNENLVGQAVREAIQEANGALKREDLFITSKVWNTHHSKDRVRVSLNETLANLGLDYVDLYLMHWPMGLEEGSDPYPVDENGVGRFSDVHYLETYKVLFTNFKSFLKKPV